VPAGVRPAAERVRQAIFGSLGDRVAGARVLDLYCGSGAYAIEALSRGAASAVGVDRDARTIKTAKANVTAAGLDDAASFVRRDAGAFVGAEARRRGPFDLVFCDPPYDEPASLERLLSQLSGALAADGVVVVEQRWSQQDAADPSAYVLVADRRYGDTRVLTFRREGRGKE
jgi:16S rRNA (guanine966-N2)-methyltransferase